ncbi:Probable S-adenosylmethionine-dependent methyltransferase MSMEG_2350 [Citrobacter youngae]|uniref:Probable S-adenosylmethionine-dependent methyltransferase MSMEG_2350 n=1 Tax=Citrobacter youngae TaxID=133448 RepID=A0A9Q7ZRW8_9ENTR|nr:class I SAM-dependent methyltransferase [Citrobacter youngae]SUX81812.1 Probable S-adenosylmethionine-dependent methyltransferase MSMEG_2350 [Citrobacter youngae]
MKDSFYSSFEGMHRGDREDIKNRLRVYLPFIKPFSVTSRDPVLLDLGCGRGEWLELVTAVGFTAKGADLDEGMLSYCTDLGLDVVQDDAISFLKQFQDNSVDVVSSFHVVEHIGFDNVKLLIHESLRVLKPGGILILETPNPENIVVASSSFYLDPTHIQPIPNQLLSFLTEYIGFARTKVLRLQENKILYSKENIELIDVIAGVSPDYSVVAQKKSDDSVMAYFDEAFNLEYGLSFNALANKFDSGLNNKFHKLSIEIDALKRELNLISEACSILRETNSELQSQIVRQVSEITRQNLEISRQGSEINEIRHLISRIIFNRIKSKIRSIRR